MWTRAELKTKGKAAFNANRWKAVLAAFILVITMGSVSVSVPGSSVASGGAGALQGVATSRSVIAVDDNTSISDDGDGGIVIYDDGDAFFIGEDGVYIDTDGNVINIDDSGIHVQRNGSPVPLREMRTPAGSSLTMGQAIIVAMSLFLVLLVAFALVLVFKALLINPAEIGAKRFFVCNLNRKADAKELAFAFDHEYLNGVKAMFLRDVFTFLWTLLFIIPGIIKSYEYRMIPYLLTENPAMDYKTAFAESKRMMSGQKWKTFVLDLSFIGWMILSALTLGILGLLYVNPYMASTSAALYERLRYGDGQPAFANKPVNGPAVAPTAPAPIAPAPFATSQAPVAPTAPAPDSPQASPEAPVAPLAPVATAPVVPQDSALAADAAQPETEAAPEERAQ